MMRAQIPGQTSEFEKLVATKNAYVMSMSVMNSIHSELKLPIHLWLQMKYDFEFVIKMATNHWLVWIGRKG